MIEPILLKVNDQGVATITLNRPELHNALDEQAIDLLIATLETLAEDETVRLVVLTGNGISFSGGHDMDWLRRIEGYDDRQVAREAARLGRLLRTLDELPRPTIARIQGPAFGIGVGLVACCDFAISVSEALFGFSDVKLGVVPSMVAPYVIRAIGPRPARRYFIGAERFNAGKAKRLGLLHQVVEDDELDHAVSHLVSQLLLNGPHAMRAAKTLVNALQHVPVGPESEQICVETITRLRTSTEGREGLKAFIEKRRPDWIA